MFVFNVDKLHSKRRINDTVDALPKNISTLKKITAYCALSILAFGINSPMAFSQTPTDTCVAEYGSWSVDDDAGKAVFTAGTSSSDTHVLVTCNAASYTDGEITGTILAAAFEALDDKGDSLDSDSVIGVSVTAAVTQVSSPISSERALILLTGVLGTPISAVTDGAVVNLYSDMDAAAHDWRIINNLDVTAKGDGRRGFGISNDSGGSVVFRNFADVVTEGKGFTRGATKSNRTRAPDGIFASADGNVTVINETDYAVTTKGAGGRGILAYVGGSGLASVVNKGTVTTGGKVYESKVGKDADNKDIYEYRRADGITANSEGGNASAVNEVGGTVTTKGDGANAVYAYSGGEAGTTATAVNRGTVIVEGTTHPKAGGGEYDAFGVVAIANKGSSSATNAKGATVIFKGIDSDAVLAWNLTSGQTADATNHGFITSTADADDATGLGAGASAGDGESTLRAVNSGSINLGGDDSAGIVSVIAHEDKSSGKKHSLGEMSAINSGSIILAGERGSATSSVTEHPAGIYAGAYDAVGGVDIGDTGNVSVANTGRITVKTGTGISTEVYGSGNSKVEVTKGTVTAGQAGKLWGAGIYSFATVDTTTTDSATDDDIHIVVSGKGTKVTGHSGATNIVKTGHDDTVGIGIWAKMIETDQPGDAHAKVEVRGEALVTGNTAVKFDGGKGTLNVRNSTVDGAIKFAAGEFKDTLTVRGSTVGNLTTSIEFNGGVDNLEIEKGVVNGNVNFGAGDDVMTMITWGKVNGDLDFGAGDDELRMDVSPGGQLGPSIITGNISNLKTAHKLGLGDVRFEGTVNFSASSLVLEKGGLIIAGTVDLNNGQVVIHSDTILAFEIGDITKNSDNYGRIIRGTAVFNIDADPEIQTQLNAGLNETDQDKVKLKLADAAATPLKFVSGGFKQEVSGQDEDDPVNVMVKATDGASVGEVLTTSNEFTSADGGWDKIVAAPAAVNTTLADLKLATSSPASSGGGSGGSSSNTDGFVGLGMVAAIFFFWDSNFLSEEETEYAYDISSLRSGSGSLTGDAPFSNKFRVLGNSSHVWVRSLADSTSSLSLGSYAKAQGTELGMDYDLGKGFRFNGSIIPEMSVSSPSSKLEGRALQLGGSWRKDSFFTELTLVHEDHDAALVTANPVVNSYLEGNSTLSNTHLHLQTGTMMNYGSVKAKTMFSMFAGDMTQSAYTAESPVLKTDIPEISQNYEGWRFGLNLTPSKAIETSGGTRLLPSLTLSTMRTTTKGIEAMTLSQSDKAGALTFRTNVQVRELPKTVNVLGLSTRIRQSANSGWKLGYAGAEIDGEFHNYALASYRMRF